MGQRTAASAGRACSAAAHGFPERRTVVATANRGLAGCSREGVRRDPDNQPISRGVLASIPVQERGEAAAERKEQEALRSFRDRGEGERQRPDCAADGRNAHTAAPESRPNVRNQNNAYCRERLPSSLMERQSRLSSDRRVAGTTRLFECTRMQLSGAMFSSSYRIGAVLNLGIGCDSLKLQAVALRRACVRSTTR